MANEGLKFIGIPILNMKQSWWSLLLGRGTTQSIRPGFSRGSCHDLFGPGGEPLKGCVRKHPRSGRRLHVCHPNGVEMQGKSPNLEVCAVLGDGDIWEYVRFSQEGNRSQGYDFF